MRKPIDNNEILNDSEFCLNDDIVSAQETTGLIPSLADDDAQMDSYKAIDEFMQNPICKRGKYNTSRHDS